MDELACCCTAVADQQITHQTVLHVGRGHAGAKPWVSLVDVISLTLVAVNYDYDVLRKGIVFGR